MGEHSIGGESIGPCVEQHDFEVETGDEVGGCVGAQGGTAGDIYGRDPKNTGGL